MMDHPCTCHISNLKCKHQKCPILIEARRNLKIALFEKITQIFDDLKKQGFDKKESLRAMRREVNHKNTIQYDIFDQAAEKIWQR